jgi:WD40 repeat protein
MHSKYIITYECHDNALRMWKVVQLEKYFDFSLYSHHFSLLSLTSLLSAPEREVTSPSDFKVVGALNTHIFFFWPNCTKDTTTHLNRLHSIDISSANFPEGLDFIQKRYFFCWSCRKEFVNLSVAQRLFWNLLAGQFYQVSIQRTSSWQQGKSW